ncbi:MAG: tripartite tricarboxylate transporter substrate binding protein, partial [Clostridiales bacterium]|nr:tripartite tricarboxylate transporter substrate binding protein [Clostridiales bacterium]
MKKVFALILALCMVFALCACGQTAAPATTEAPAADAAVDAPAESTGWAPDGPVTMIVSYKAGNGTDVTARVLAQYAEKYIGQTVVIENVDGGSGSLGWSQLAAADPDGMTIG